MTERSITVRIKSDVASAIVGVKATAAAVRDFTGEVGQSAVKNRAAWAETGRGFAAGGALIIGALGLAAHEAAEFDQAMSLVKANIDDDSVPSMQRLADAALNAGRTTAFSAKEAADAEGELAKAGVSAADIIGGALTASLNLASAGQIGLEESASILSSTMVQFSLSGKDAAHVADVLAAGADKSLGGVTDLGEGLKYAGVNASQFGLTVDDTVGALAEFASRGVLGSMAGTSLRQMFIQLAAPTSEASDLLAKYNINAFDAQGKFVGLSALAGQLATGLGGLTDQQRQATLSIVFGARSLSEANILYQDGAAGVQAWTDAVGEQGFAAEQARTKLDNLNGDLTKLKNTFNVALIETGQEAQGALRGLAQETTNLIDAYNQLSPAAKGVVSGTAAVVGGILLLGGAAIIAIPKILAFKTALATMTGGGGVLSSITSIAKFLISPWGIAMVAATGFIALWVKSNIDAAARVRALTDALEQDSYALGANTREAIANNLEKQGLIEQAKKFGVGLVDLSQAAEGNADAQARVNQALDDYVNKIGQTAQGGTAAAKSAAQQTMGVDAFRSALFGANTELDKAKVKAADHAAILGDEATKQHDAATAGHTFTDSLKVQSGALQDAKFDVTEFDQALKDLFDQHFSVKKAQDDLVSGFHDLRDAAKDNGKKLEGNTKGALANRDALRQLTQKAYDVVQAYADTGASSDEVKAKAAAVKEQFIKQATAIYGAHAKLTPYTSALDDLPATVSTNVTLTGVSIAKAQLAALKRSMGALQFYAHQKDSGTPTDPNSAVGSRSTHGRYGLVGEEGPEIVKLPAGSSIYPTGQAPRDAVPWAQAFAGGAPAGQGGGGGLTIGQLTVAAPLSGNPYSAGERLAQGAQRQMAVASGRW